MEPVDIMRLRMHQTIFASTSKTQPYKHKMLTTFEMHEVKLQSSIGGKDERYWQAALFPLDVGVFLIEVDWTEKARCVQPIALPATFDGLTSLRKYSLSIFSMLFIPPPKHDGSVRVAPFAVDTIDIGLDPLRSFGRVLLMRDSHGNWHACDSNVDINMVEQRSTVMRTES